MRIEMDAVYSMLLNAPVDAVPLIALAGTLIWNGAEDGQAAAHCVDACLNLHYALAEYGINSQCVELAVLEHVDGLGQVTGAVWAAA